MHCCFFFQEPILKIWLQIVVEAGAINFDALHQLLYLSSTVIVCPDIPLPAHAVQVSCNKHFRGQCVFDCVDGHVRTGGDDVRVCEYGAVWTGDDIVCSGKYKKQEKTLENPFYITVLLPRKSEKMGLLADMIGPRAQIDLYKAKARQRVWKIWIYSPRFKYNIFERKNKSTIL